MKTAYSGADILKMAMAGECSWEYSRTIERGVYRGYVELEVTNIPNWPGSKTKIVIPGNDYEALKKDSPNT